MKSHDSHRGKRSWKYDLGEDDPHIPNKEEAKLLRKLMSETGNTEEEIRSIPKYRKMLANAQKSSEEGEKGYWKHKEYERFLKSIRKTTGLPNEHPLSKLEYNKVVENSSPWRFRYHEKKKLHYTKKDIEYFEENNINYKDLTIPNNG